MEQLKSCPFCGSVAFLQKRKKYKSFPYRVKCANINCGNKTANWDSIGGAIIAWNRRINNGT